jgi:hypothetical protein
MDPFRQELLENWLAQLDVAAPEPESTILKELDKEDFPKDNE